MKSKTKVSFLLTLLIIFLFFSILNSRFSKYIIANNNYLEFNEKNQIQIKQSGFWNLTGSAISIDDSDPSKNWTYTASHYDWCSGSGKWADPYVIENVTINGQISSSYIEINNSDAYFIIRNCSLYNSGSSSTKACINLYSVDNGKIINNNCVDNDSIGIYLDECNNNTLSGNIIINNFYGIYLDECNNNTLSGNTAIYNYIGINLNQSNNTTLLGNTINNNTYGIGLIYSDNNTLSGNTANNNYCGIIFGISNENIISGNIVSNSNYYGIYLDNSSNNTFLGNTINNSNYIGIYLVESDNNTFSGNTLNNCNDCGIYLGYSNNNTLLGNLMNFCGIYLFGSLVEMASHSIDDTNLVNNKPVYYYVNEIGLESSNFINAGQIILINCNKSIISGLNLSYSTMGIYLGYSNNNTLSGNTANNNSYGMYLYESINNTLSGNTANNNSYGMSLFESINNTLSGNIADNNNDNGIFLYRSDYNTLSENTANSNDNGIELFFSHDNTFSGNDASNNNNYGIEFSVSNNNTFSGNTISNNFYGICLDSQSNNNKIFLNNFIDNEINAEDNGINNKWDDGFTGNYWDDYVGVDANDNGIGDTPYIVPGTAGSQDNFPIWTVGDNIAPVITLIFPLPDSIFGLVAPNYSISINELNLDTIWYTLDGGGTNYTITSLTGTFNQIAWEALSEGNVTIRFYANDSAGNISFIDVEVIIEISEDRDDLPIISFGNYYILFMFLTILSFIILEKHKKK